MQFTAKKKNFVHHQLVYTETRRKQRLPNNFWAKFFHCFLKQTVNNFELKIVHCNLKQTVV